MVFVCMYSVCMYICMHVYQQHVVITNKVILLQNESIQVTRLQGVPLIIFSKGLAVDSKFE